MRDRGEITEGWCVYGLLGVGLLFGLLVCFSFWDLGGSIFQLREYWGSWVTHSIGL